jgi:hypothetical protein
VRGDGFAAINGEVAGMVAAGEMVYRVPSLHN